MEQDQYNYVDVLDTEAVPEIGHLYNIDKIIYTARRYAETMEYRGLKADHLIADFGGSGIVSGLLSADPVIQGYAEWRLYRAFDIAEALGADKIVLPYRNDPDKSKTLQEQVRLKKLLSLLIDHELASGISLQLSEEIPAYTPSADNPDCNASNRTFALSITSRT